MENLGSSSAAAGLLGGTLVRVAADPWLGRDEQAMTERRPAGGAFGLRRRPVG